MKENKKEKIITAATKLFEEKGFEGVKMRVLSEKAGVNKGLLHYYFKNKDVIFMEVFKRKAGKLYLNLENLLVEENATFKEKVAAMVDQYFKLLLVNPKLPLFVFSEVNKNPKLMEQIKLSETISGTVSSLSVMLKKEKATIDAFQFLMSMISLCVFPFIMKPLIGSIAKKQNIELKDFYTNRKSIIVQTLVNSI